MPGTHHVRDGSSPAAASDDSATGGRSAPSPRLIEWTGERCVPWAPDYQTVYEHLHRYHFAAQLCVGKRVLDLASGEGYGSAILGTVATEVIGIDIDHPTVEHARANHESDTVHFLEGSMLDRAALGDDTFDVVVCFEALEHVEDHEALLDVVGGVLREGGVFIVSTPDRTVYTDVLHNDNPFHVHELDREELRAFLAQRFAHVALLGQMVVTGSVMEALEPSVNRTAELITVAGEDDSWPRRPDFDAPYLMGVASNAELPALPDLSTLVDADVLLARRPASEAALLARSQQVHIEHLEEVVRGLAYRDEDLRQTLATREQQLKNITNSKGWRAVMAFRRVVHSMRRLTPSRDGSPFGDR